ncbi:MAG: GNAT family N-acetyltransferase [Actinomycetes bacterium]
MTPTSPTAPPTASLRLWRELTGLPDGLAPGTRTVVRGSRGLCPPGWTGVLRLGDAHVVEAGQADDDALEALLALDDPADPTQVEALMRGAVLGPGHLAYLPDGTVPPPAPDDATDADPDELAAWLVGQRPDEVEESSAADLERARVVRRRGRIAGVAGWTTWPTGVAHVGVLVDPAHRGEGVGTDLGLAASAAALADGLAPQWRAAGWNEPSRRLGARVGFIEVGCQLSIEAIGT